MNWSDNKIKTKRNVVRCHGIRRDVIHTLEGGGRRVRVRVEGAWECSRTQAALRLKLQEGKV
eukprot:scaffold70590_cov14-Prasinocladus_malaysianus.AAC.1